MAKILGRDEQIAGRVHQTGRFRTYLLFHGGNAGIAAIGTFRSFQSCDHIACLDAQSQRNHVGERGRTFQRNRKIAGERACENRIGNMRNVIFRGRLIDAGNRRGGSGNRLSSAPQPRDRLAILPHPRAQQIQPPQNARQRIRLGAAPQFGDHVNALAVHQREHALHQFGILRMMHAVQQCGRRSVAHLVDLRRIGTSRDIVGHHLVELPRAGRTRRSGVGETGGTAWYNRSGTVMHASRQWAKPFEYR